MYIYQDRCKEETRHSDNLPKFEKAVLPNFFRQSRQISEDPQICTYIKPPFKKGQNIYVHQRKIYNSKYLPNQKLIIDTLKHSDTCQIPL